MKKQKVLLVALVGLGLLLPSVLSAQIKTEEVQQRGTNSWRGDYVLPPQDVILSYDYTTSGEGASEEVSPEELGPESLSDQEMEVVLSLRLSSLKDLSKIHVKIGYTPGGADYMHHVFQNLAGGVDSSGYRLVRSGRNLKIFCGTQKGVGKLYAWVVLEDHRGNKSEASYHYPE